MTAPKRIQRKRTKGWRMPEGAVYVGRPTRWGNPFRVVPVHRSGPFDLWHGPDVFLGQFTDLSRARQRSVERFREAVAAGWGDVPWPAEIREQLAGHNLACWCPIDQPCHADVLLELANA